jgi:chloramphenicol O-acetyltransferase type B
MQSVGKYTYGCQNVRVWVWGDHGHTARIGAFGAIAEGCNIYLGENHRTDRVSSYPFGHIHQATFNAVDGRGHPVCKGDVVIGNDVWIGQNVTIMSGVTVGDGAVLGAGSIVTRDVEPYAVVAGNPAKVVKMRFPRDVVRGLLALKWWEWDDQKINAALPLLTSTDIRTAVLDLGRRN